MSVLVARLGCAGWLMAASAMAVPVLAATPIKVFLLIGQSNMSGWTNSSGMPAANTASQPNVLIYADGEIDGSKKKKWLNNGMDFGHAAGWFGPELMFGKTLSDSMPGTKIALIKHSVGSTYLATNWRPPASGGTVGPLFTASLATVTSGLASLDAQYTPQWSGILWMQGEFDGQNQGYANEYQTNLGNLVKDYRSKLSVADLPFIIGMIDSSNSWQFAGTIRTAERNVAKNLTNVGLVDTKGFATDGTHYKLDGMIALGRGFALNYLTKFRTPVTAISPSVAKRADTPVLRMGLNGFPALCQGYRCFAADGRRDAVSPHIPERPLQATYP
ncbi:MAG: sialate O-acetylesterase [Fibrobacteria bacterium]